MEFSISSEEKIRQIEAIILQTEITLYGNLASAGYDPSTFDESSFVIPEEAFPMSIYHVIAGLLEKLANLRAILAGI